MKTIAMAVVSIDGKISRSKRSPLDWTSKEDKKLYEATTKKIGVMVLGRTTFENMENPWPGRMHYVLTSKFKKMKNIEGSVKYIWESPKKVLKRIEEDGFDKALIAGGSTVYTSFLKAKCIDEIWLTIEPVVFGSGIDIFGEYFETRLKLLSRKMLNKNTFFIKYKVIK